MFYISKFCLLCLKEDDGTFKNVENKDSSNVSIQEKLDYCVFELVSSGHEFPGYVCQNCLEHVEMFYNFKQKCFKNNRKIRNLMDSLKQMHFSGITFRDLSIPIKDININTSGKRKSIDISKQSELKVMKNLLQETKLNKSKVIFKCEDCPKQFYMKRQLKSHQKTHTQQTYECNICGIKFNHKRSLQFHMKLHDVKLKNKLNKSEIKPGKKLKIETRLNKSENDMKPKKCSNESGKGKYECGICFKQLTYKHNLKRHFLTLHSQDKIKKSNVQFPYKVIHSTEDPTKPNIFNSTMNTIDLTDDNDSDVELVAYNADIIELKDELKEQDADRKMYDEILHTNVARKRANSCYELSVNKENVATKNDLKEIDITLQCFICDKSFTRNCKLHAHLKAHFDESPY